MISTLAYAHEARVLKVQSDGSIREIPAALGAVFFKVKNLGTESPHIEFQVADHRTILPSCLTRFIRSKNRSEIHLFGSWHHDETEGLPYYVSVKFLDPKQDPQLHSKSNYDLLFSLRNAQLMQVLRWDSDGAGGGRYSSLPLDKDCKRLLPGLKETSLGSASVTK